MSKRKADEATQKLSFWKIERLFAYVLTLLAAVILVLLLLPDSNTPLPPPSPIYPTPPPYPTATADPRPSNLPDHCWATGDTYQLQFVQPENEPFHHPDDQLWSPDRRYLVESRLDGVFVQNPNSDGSTIRLSDHEAYVLHHYHWSPNSNRLAYLYASETDFGQTFIDIFDFSAGLDDDMLVLTSELPMSSHAYFLGWSNRGNHLAFRTERFGLGIWSVAQQQMVYESSVRLDNYAWGGSHVWSPDDSRMAYVWQDEYSNRFLTILSMDDWQETVFLLVDLDPNQYHSIQSVRWSPDGSQVALYSRDGSGIDRVYLNRVDGEQIRLDIFNGPEIPVAHFSADGQTILYWQTLQGENYLLSEWNPVDDTHRVLLKASQPPFFDQEGPPLLVASAQSRMALFTEHPDGTASISVEDANGDHVTPFLERVIAAGHPNWSPIGETVAAAWAAEEDGRREVRVSWMNSGGWGYTEVDGDFIDVRDFLWSPDGKILTYIGAHEAGYSLEWADVQIGETKVLMTGLAEVVNRTFDLKTGVYSMRWQTVDGELAYAYFSRDGDLLYSVTFADSDETPIGDFGDLFWADDGLHVALKGRGFGGERLLLMDPDGSDTHLIRSGLGGLGDPLWSPDGALLAFSQSDRRWGPIEVHIVDTEGNDRWSFSTDALYQGQWPPFTSLAWVPCE